MEYIYLTIGVFALAIFLRIYKIHKTHLLWWDEASYFREARFMYTFLKFALSKEYSKLFFKLAISDHQALNKTPEEAAYLIEGFKKNVILDYLIYGKPGNHFFIVLCYGLFGIKEFCVILPNVILGILTVVIVYSLGLYVGNIQTAIASALVLAVSGAHLYYSRNGQVEGKVAFFFSIAVFYYLLLVQNTYNTPFYLVGFLLIICGLALNWCGACSPLWYQPLLGILIFSDFIATLVCIPITSLNHFGSLTSDIIARFILLGLLILAFMLVWDIPHLIQKTFFPYLSNFPTYLERLFQRGGIYASFEMLIKLFLKIKTIFTKSNENKSKDIDPVSLMFKQGIKAPLKLTYGFYPYYIFIAEGPVILGLLLISILYIILKPTYLSLFITLIFISLFTMLTLVAWRPARASIILRPLIALIIGIFLSTLPNWLFFTLLAIITVYGVINSIKYLNLYFPFKEACDFAKNNGPGKIVALNYHLASVYYQEQDIISPLAYDLNTILDLVKKGELKYIIIDVLARGFYKDIKWIDEIEKQTPVFRKENPCVVDPVLFAEIELLYPPSGNNLEFKLSPNELEREVRVYDLEKFFFKPSEINKQGEDLFMAQRYQEAEAKFRKAIEMDNTYSLAYNNLAVLLWEIKKDITAIDYIKKAFDLTPDDYNTVINYLKIAYESNNLDKVKMLLEVLSKLEIKPEDKYFVEAVKNNI